MLEPEGEIPVAASIARYQSAQPNPSGECPEKIDVVQLLESRFGEAAVATFLLGVLRDRKEYDLARVEVCRVLLGLDSQAVPWAEECAAALLVALADPEEDLVRRWAARALVLVANVKGVEEALVEVVVDPEQDVDVRHNALAALRFRSLSNRGRAALAGSTDDAELGNAIARRLSGSNSA